MRLVYPVIPNPCRWVAALFAVIGCMLMFVGRVDATSLTWSGSDTPGGTESAAHWSADTNWVEAVVPVPSEALETLTFPQLTNNRCASVPPTSTCYLTLNDVEGLTVDIMQSDDANDYQLFGDKIRLGEGGSLPSRLMVRWAQQVRLSLCRLNYLLRRNGVSPSKELARSRKTA